MIYITGDTHGTHTLGKLRRIPAGAKDFIIILGDAAIVFDEGTHDMIIQDWIRDAIKATVLFIDGNHDNIDALAKYPIDEWHNGRVHKISDRIIHLMRGEIYNIDGINIFTMGGERSVDKQYRQPGVSWWEAEIPTDEELYQGLRNIHSLAARDEYIDYVLTHGAPLSMLPHVVSEEDTATFGEIPPNKLNYYLELIYRDKDFITWYCGHYHKDIVTAPNFRCLYNDVVTLQV